MQYEQDVLRKLQLAELNILRDIDSVCRAEGIPYFLECGTLLGACGTEASFRGTTTSTWECFDPITSAS